MNNTIEKLITLRDEDYIKCRCGSIIMKRNKIYLEKHKKSKKHREWVEEEKTNLWMREEYKFLKNKNDIKKY